MRILVGPKLSDIVSANSILLINPPAIDTRIPWAEWQQPLGLLQIGTTLKSQGCSVRLIDSLQSDNSKLPKIKVGETKIEEYKIDIWQHGIAPKKISQVLRSWIKEGWSPETILVSSGLSCWWQGVASTITEIKNVTSVPIILGGQYPTAYPEHAIENTKADILAIGQLQNLDYLPTNFGIYAPLQVPNFAAIQAFKRDANGALSSRPIEVILDEITQKCDLGVSSFVWYDEWLLPEHKGAIVKLLDALITRNIKVSGSRISPKMIAPGNFSPRLIDKEIAILLKKANFRFISLHDDLIHTPYKCEYLSSFDDYLECMNALNFAGFPTRNGDIDAAIIVGIPGENIKDVTIRMLQLSSIVGSIHLVPYQYSPGFGEGPVYADWLAKHNGHLDLASLNGKLFPLARIAGAKLESYWELTRLMALLNSKFHSKTHDFLSNSLVSHMVKKSLESQLWNPFNVNIEEAFEAHNDLESRRE